MTKKHLIPSLILALFSTQVYAFEWSVYHDPGLIQVTTKSKVIYVFTAGGSAKPYGLPSCPKAYSAIMPESPNSNQMYTTIQIAKLTGSQIRYAATCHLTQPDKYINVEAIQAK